MSHPRPAVLRRGAAAIAACALLLQPLAGLARPAPRPAAPTPAEAVRRILGEALASDDAYDGLAELCDSVGNRPSGSPALDKAIAWAQARMQKAGLRNVRAEPVTVPAWSRGEERARLLSPLERPLSILGLGPSPATPDGGLTADAVVVSSFDELHQLGEAAVRGRIVVYDVPYTGYGETVRYRAAGAAEAQKLGAVAVLVRSIGPISYDTPHTGFVFYPPGAPRIPAAATTIEEASALHRMAARGQTPRIHLELGGRTLPDAPSANVVGEVVGRERPEEVVLLGAHLDSWDVGQGAQDDGAGVIEVMEAAHLLARLGLAPRRTVRVVLFTNEESGLQGGKGYAWAHLAELPRHVAVLESDSGAAAIRNFTVDQRPRGLPEVWPPVPRSAEVQAQIKQLFEGARPRIEKATAYLEPLGATRVDPGHAGADLEAMLGEGVLGIGIEHDTTHYFDVHHTRADTFDKVDRHVLRSNVAVVTALAYLLAELL